MENTVDYHQTYLQERLNGIMSKKQKDVKQ